MKAKNIKFKSVIFSNKTKQIDIQYFNGKQVKIHFGSLGIKKNISSIAIDSKTNGKTLAITFADGLVDYLPYDQPLVLGGDPETLLQLHIERITAKINLAIETKKISKRFLAEQLGTSDNQIQRLLNPSILNKNLTQLYKILDLLGLELNVTVRSVA